jgi:hypothetical protein
MGRGVCCSLAFEEQSLLPTGKRRCGCCRGILEVSVRAVDAWQSGGEGTPAAQRRAVAAGGSYVPVPGITTGGAARWPAYAKQRPKRAGGGGGSGGDGGAGDGFGGGKPELFMFRHGDDWVFGPSLGQRPWLLSVAAPKADHPFSIGPGLRWRLWAPARAQASGGEGAGGAEASSAPSARLLVRCEAAVASAAPSPAAPPRVPADDDGSGEWVSNNATVGGSAAGGSSSNDGTLRSAAATAAPTPRPTPPSPSPTRAPTPAAAVCRHIELRCPDLATRPDAAHIIGLVGMYSLVSLAGSGAEPHHQQQQQQQQQQPQQRPVYRHLSLLGDDSSEADRGVLSRYLFYDATKGAWAVGAQVGSGGAVEMAVRTPLARPQLLGMRRWTFVRWGGGFGPIIASRCMHAPPPTHRSRGAAQQQQQQQQQQLGGLAARPHHSGSLLLEMQLQHHTLGSVADLPLVAAVAAALDCAPHRVRLLRVWREAGGAVGASASVQGAGRSAAVVARSPTMRLLLAQGLGLELGALRVRVVGAHAAPSWGTQQPLRSLKHRHVALVGAMAVVLACAVLLVRARKPQGSNFGASDNPGESVTLRPLQQQGQNAWADDWEVRWRT